MNCLLATAFLAVVSISENSPNTGFYFNSYAVALALIAVIVSISATVYTTWIKQHPPHHDIYSRKDELAKLEAEFKESVIRNAQARGDMHEKINKVALDVAGLRSASDIQQSTLARMENHIIAIRNAK